MYARLVQSLPQGPEWLYEVKFDGYRCLAGRDEKGVTLWSRRENHFTKQFPHIAQASESLPPNTLIDGEIVALDDSGKVSFNLLQHHLSKAQALVFYAFDVLIYRGRRVLDLPLYFRRELLHKILGDTKATPIGLSENIEAAPKDLIRVVKQFGFEGIVARFRLRVWEANRCMGQVQGQPGAGVCHRRLHNGQSHRCNNRRLLQGRAAALCRQGEKWLCASASP